VSLKFVLACATALALAGAAQAQSVTNGSFEVNTGTGQVGYNTTVAGWSVPDPHVGGSYTFLFGPGTADTTGAPGQFGQVILWGPGNTPPTPNGLPPTSPDGGFYIASDPVLDNHAPGLTQVITGLTPGQQYDVGFYEAFAQQHGFIGPTTNQWNVSLGGQTLSGPTVTIPSMGFSPWTHINLIFTATGTSETLGFLASSPSLVASPPFALLDGVSLTSVVPEPSVWAMLMVGVFAIGAAARRRRFAALAAC